MSQVSVSSKRFQPGEGLSPWLWKPIVIPIDRFTALFEDEEDLHSEDEDAGAGAGSPGPVLADSTVDKDGLL